MTAQVIPISGPAVDTDSLLHPHQRGTSRRRVAAFRFRIRRDPASAAGRRSDASGRRLAARAQARGLARSRAALRRRPHHALERPADRGVAHGSVGSSARIHRTRFRRARGCGTLSRLLARSLSRARRRKLRVPRRAGRVAHAPRRAAARHSAHRSDDRRTGGVRLEGMDQRVASREDRGQRPGGHHEGGGRGHGHAAEVPRRGLADVGRVVLRAERRARGRPRARSTSSTP